MQKTNAPKQDAPAAPNQKPTSTSAKEEKAKWHRCQSFKVLLQNRMKDKTKIANHRSNIMVKKNPKQITHKFDRDTNATTKTLDRSLSTDVPLHATAPGASITDAPKGTTIEAQATSMPREEINKLIKKMTLGFSAMKNESSFFMQEGLFAGTIFHLTSKDKNLYMDVKHGSIVAHKILREHEGYLQKRLEQHEINLKGIAFI